jgi:hypothetical protein
MPRYALKALLDGMRDLVSHRDGVDHLHVGAVDREHADRLVGAVGDERELARRRDAQAGGLFCTGDRGNQLGWSGLEVDDVDLIVGHLLERVAFLDDIHGIGDERDRLARVYGDVDWRSHHRILERKVADDLGVERIGKVDDQNRILSGRRQDRLEIVVPQKLFIVGGISFGGVIAFIFADLIVVPILDIYRKYYGLKMATFLFVMFYVAMAGAALIVEAIFVVLGLIPIERNARVAEASDTWNYTTWLNIVFLVLAASLVWRFLKTGGPEMLRMMNRPAGAGHAH